MNPVFGGSESARQPFQPIRPFTEADRPIDGDSTLAAALSTANAAISQDHLPPAPALAYRQASDPPYNASSSPDSIAVGPVVPVVPAVPAVQKPRVSLKKSGTSKAPAKKGKKAKNAAAAEDAEDQENAKRKAYWVEEEERVLTQEYGRLRQLKRKFEGVADRLNDEFYHKDPKSYPFKRESEECYNKWRSLKATWTKEAAKACKHNMSLSETGQPTDGTDMFQTKWHLHAVWYECCVKGNKADEDEQTGTDIVQRSALPGVHPPKAAAQGSPSSSLDGHIKLNRAAREAHNRQKRTRAHQQGTRMLQEQMDSMASMSRVSEEAANQRAIDQRQFQYDMMVYQAAVQDRHCRQRMQAAQNADISRSNDQALKYAELTNTHPLPMRQAVWVIFPEPVRPQPPVNGQQQAAAADAQAADRAAVAPTPYTVMPQGRQLAITPALVGSEAAALHASTAVSGS